MVRRVEPRAISRGDRPAAVCVWVVSGVGGVCLFFLKGKTMQFFAMTVSAAVRGCRDGAILAAVWLLLRQLLA